MIIETNVEIAERRLKKFIVRRAQELRMEVQDIFWSKVTISVSDTDQFYRLVNHCNQTYGKGKHCWTVRGRVLRFVDPTKKAYNPPAVKEWIVKQPGLDLSYLLSI